MNEKSDCTKKELDSDDEKIIMDILPKLKFISKIEEHEKVDTKNLTLCQNGIITRLYRYYTEQDRHTVFVFIQNTIREAFEVCFLYFSKGETIAIYRKIASMILSALIDCKKGIQKLCVTYAYDRMYISKIDTLTEILDTKITELRNSCTT